MKNDVPNMEETGSERRALVSAIAFGIIFIGLVIAVYEMFFAADHLPYNRDFVVEDMLDVTARLDSHQLTVPSVGPSDLLAEHSRAE